MSAEVAVVEQGLAPAEHDFGEVDFDRVRHLVIVQQGREFLPYSGLVELLHQVSEGYFSIETQLVQAPTQDNGQVAICTARVLIYDPDNPDVVRRAATGIGDANPANVSRAMAPHLIRMAETRAKARALRDAVNVGMVAFEELGPGGAEDSPSKPPEATSAPFTPPERIQIRGQWYTRPQVVAGYKKVVAEAQAVGLAIPPGDVVADEAPLPVLAGAAQGLRTRLDARDGKDREGLAP